MPAHSESMQYPYMMAAAKRGAKSVKSMSKHTTAVQRIVALFRPHKPSGFLHSRLAAIAGLCGALTVAPQVMAVVCAPPITLAANQWRMVGIPCNPANGAILENIFDENKDPNLVAANYNVTWVAWKRTYTSSGDSYTKMAATDPLKPGDAIWLYTTVAGLLQVKGTPTPPAGGIIVTGPPALTSGASRYIMYANPYADPLLFSSLLFTVGASEVTTTQAVTSGYLSSQVHYWNGNTYGTLSLLVGPAPTFVAHESAWINTLPNYTVTTIKAPKP